MQRYSRITTKMPREFCLLQGTGCAWKQCTFCDYYLDSGEDPYAINAKCLSQVTGEFGVLDIINSGSCVELDSRTIDLIKHVVSEKKIHTLWFEAHYMYKDRLGAFAENFPGISVRYRTGIETFDSAQRNIWKKGVASHVTPAMIAESFQGVCLLFAVCGQSRSAVSEDIRIALQNFAYFSINAFIENGKGLQRDEEMVQWFMEEWYPILKDRPGVEILLNNTDLGVG